MEMEMESRSELGDFKNRKLPRIVKNPKNQKKVLMGYVNGKRVPVNFHRSDSMKRKVSETLKRTWANRSEAYIEKMSNAKSVAKWNSKVSPEAIEKQKRKRKLLKKILKIVPREKNHSGVVFK